MNFFSENANRFFFRGFFRAWVAHWAGRRALAGFPGLMSVGGVGEVGLVLGLSHFPGPGPPTRRAPAGPRPPPPQRRFWRKWRSRTTAILAKVAEMANLAGFEIAHARFWRKWRSILAKMAGSGCAKIPECAEPETVANSVMGRAQSLRRSYKFTHAHQKGCREPETVAVSWLGWGRCTEPEAFGKCHHCDAKSLRLSAHFIVAVQRA